MMNSGTAMQVLTDGLEISSRLVMGSGKIRAPRELSQLVNYKRERDLTDPFNPHRETHGNIICNSYQPKPSPHLRLRRFGECDTFVQSSDPLKHHEAP